MNQFKKVFQALALVALLAAPSADASKIQKQGIVGTSDCTTRGIANSACLPDDNQIFVNANGINSTLNAAITAGNIGGGGGGGGGVQLLSNPGFEIGSTGAPPASWTLSSATGTLSTAQIYAGAQSELLTLSAQTPVLSQDYTPTQPLTGVNLEASCHVLTTQTTAEVCAREAGASLGSSYCTSVPSTGQWQYVPVNFVGPSSGSIGVQVTTTGSTTGTIYVDNCYVGPATNLSQVSQAQLLGTSLWANGTNTWTLSSTLTTYSVFPANASIPAPTLTGVLTAPATKIPAVVIPSAGPGAYYLVATGAFLGNTAGANNFMTFSDGTTNGADNILGFTGVVGNDDGTGSIISTFQYTTSQTNLTFQIVGRSTISGKSVNIGDGNSPDNFQISVYYYPSQSQLAVNSAASAVNWSGTSTLTGTTTSTSYADPGSISGSITQTSSRNLTCTAASGLLGITCTLPRTGNYSVCYSGYSSNSSAANTGTELTDGSNVVIVGSQLQGIYTAGATAPFGGCSNYSGTVGSTTFKLRGLVGSGTGTFDPTSFSIILADSPIGAPILTQSAISDAANSLKMFNVLFAGNAGNTAVCSTSPCTSAVISGTAITNVTRNSTGNYTLNVASGTCSGPVVCNVNPSSIGSDAYATVSQSALPTATAFGFITRASGNTATDGSGILQCSCNR